MKSWRKRWNHVLFKPFLNNSRVRSFLFSDSFPWRRQCMSEILEKLVNLLCLACIAAYFECKTASGAWKTVVQIHFYVTINYLVRVRSLSTRWLDSCRTVSHNPIESEQYLISTVFFSAGFCLMHLFWEKSSSSHRQKQRFSILSRAK